jgi:hypothetical protein
MPTKAYPNDFCYDVIAVSEQGTAPNVWRYGIGLALQLVREDDTQPLTFIEADNLGLTDRGANGYGSSGK